MKLFSINLICILALSTGFVLGQIQPCTKAKNVRPSKPSKTKLKRKPIRTISLGVINGRAIDLVTPKYPEIAKAVNVYGQVQIAVIIDPNGKVISTSVLKGHPLLRSVALKAASESTFQPMLIGGDLVRVNGIIYYNFLLTQWNWLEIGFTLGGGTNYYTLKNLITQLPPGIGDESRLLDPTAQSVGDWEQAIGTTIAIIRSKLSTDQRSNWLFEVGLKIAKMKSICCRIDDDMVSNANDMRSFLLSVPPNASPVLLNRLRRLVFLVENPGTESGDLPFGSPIYKLLVDMEDRFPFIVR